jgi:hypothetical protein
MGHEIVRYFVIWIVQKYIQIIRPFLDKAGVRPKGDSIPSF